MLSETSANDEHSGNKIIHKPLWKTEASQVLLYVVYGVFAVLASYLNSYGENKSACLTLRMPTAPTQFESKSR
jgi:hypothetical protein